MAVFGSEFINSTQNSAGIHVEEQKEYEHQILHHILKILKVAHVTASTKDGVVPNSVQSLDILESCKRTIRCYTDIVRAQDDEGPEEVT